MYENPFPNPLQKKKKKSLFFPTTADLILVQIHLSETEYTLLYFSKGWHMPHGLLTVLEYLVNHRPPYCGSTKQAGHLRELEMNCQWLNLEMEGLKERQKLTIHLVSGFSH